jgi:hypothetical protein
MELKRSTRYTLPARLNWASMGRAHPYSRGGECVSCAFEPLNASYLRGLRLRRQRQPLAPRRRQLLGHVLVHRSLCRLRRLRRSRPVPRCSILNRPALGPYSDRAGTGACGLPTESRGRLSLTSGLSQCARLGSSYAADAPLSTMEPPSYLASRMCRHQCCMHPSRS